MAVTCGRCVGPRMAHIFSLGQRMAPSENGGRLTERSLPFCGFIPMLLHPSVLLPTNAILLVHQGTAQFAFGTSRPTCKWETRFGMTTNSGFLSYPLTEVISPVP